MTRMEIAMRFVLCLLLVGFLSACGGGGGGNAFVPGSGVDTVTVDTRLRAANGELFSAVGASGSLTDGNAPASETNARAVLRELGALRAAEEEITPPTFYEQLLNGVDASGNAGNYEVTLLDKDYPHTVGSDDRRFERALETLAIYNYVVVAWGDYSTVFDNNTNHFIATWFPAFIPSSSVPISGDAIYDLEGRGALARYDENVPAGARSDFATAIYQVILTGELTADFEADTVGGYLESDYGYKIAGTGTPGIGPINHIPQDITAAKYFGSDRTNTPSELTGSVRMDFLQGELVGTGEEYTGARWFVGPDFGESCGMRACFAADVNIAPGMATGDFAGLADARLDGFIRDRVGHDNGNRWGYILGQFAGPDEEEAFGVIQVLNQFGGEGVPVNVLGGFFVGAKRPGQN